MPKSSMLPTRFDCYEIHGITEYEESGNKWCEQVAEDEATFWSIFGHIPGEGSACIGDFRTREHAEDIYARITGRCYATEPKNSISRQPESWDAMLAALRFALPLMEDLANSSDNTDEHRAAQLMRDAIAMACGPLGG